MLSPDLAQPNCRCSYVSRGQWPGAAGRWWRWQGKSHRRSFPESSIHPPIPSTSPFHELEELTNASPRRSDWSSLAGVQSSGLPEARLTHLGAGGGKPTLFLSFLTATADSLLLHHCSHLSTSEKGSTEPQSCTCLGAFKSAENGLRGGDILASLLRLHPEMTQIARSQSS